MKQEARICQNCQKSFEIYEADFAFYEKIKVPPPTWCPDCRMIRRMAFWNERNFFKRKDENGKIFLSSFPPEAPLKLVDKDVWWSDEFDATKYGRDYDFSRPFFDQLRELMLEVPAPVRSVRNMVNSDYSNNANNLKNCYMCFNSSYNEDCLYGVFMGYSKDCMDVLNVGYAESCYEIFSEDKGYKVFFAQGGNSNRECYLMQNSFDCINCFGCVNLRHKQYYIFNQPYTKEEYFKKLEEFNLGSYESLAKLRKQFREFALQFPNKYIYGEHNFDVIGEDVVNSKNAKYCYQGIDLENVSYSQAAVRTDDSYDLTNWGGEAELVYESVECGGDIREIKFSYDCSDGCESLEYCVTCHGSENCFGSIGMKKQKYCILNKKYSKEDYEALKKKIIAHMDEMPYIDKKGRVYKYGEYLPPEMSAFAANETAILDFTDMDKDKAEGFGLAWRDPRPLEYKITKPSKDLPDHIKDVSDDVLKEIIGCAGCGRAYRIVPKELDFYKRFNLPLPRICHDCRFDERIKYRNFPKWYDRSCECGGAQSDRNNYKNVAKHFHNGEHCPNKFKTAYSPERKEIVYCEKCYVSEVL